MKITQEQLDYLMQKLEAFKSETNNDYVHMKHIKIILEQCVQEPKLKEGPKDSPKRSSPTKYMFPS